ncbi:hypothetical protein Hanom_Chr11g01019701 [Helianthus anomalus]
MEKVCVYLGLWRNMKGRFFFRCLDLPNTNEVPALITISIFLQLGFMVAGWVSGIQFNNFSNKP